jgi:hypothetical protein
MSPEGGGTTSPRPNFVLQLAKDLTELESSTSGVRQVVEVAISVRFLAVVLGTDWATRKLTPQAKHDEWMQNRLKHKGMSGIVWGHRVVRLANAFHTLLQAHVKGFDILPHRFHKRPTKPCFIETEIASLLTVNGFTVEIIGESGVRGRDFDLSARRDEITLSIEVTGKEGARLTANAIKNTLKHKRTQIPRPCQPFCTSMFPQVGCGIFLKRRTYSAEFSTISSERHIGSTPSFLFGRKLFRSRGVAPLV